MLEPAPMFACQDDAIGNARFGLLQIFPKAGPQFSLLAAFAIGLQGGITGFWHPGVTG
jgi:hypothetical protein